MLSTISPPVTRISPSTSNLNDGELVPIPTLFVDASVKNNSESELPLIVKSTLLPPLLNLISRGGPVLSFKSKYDIPPILNLSLSSVKLR